MSNAPFLLLMPSYNQAHYIREAVDSCLAQDDPDWELWILDNSTDGTPDAMASYTDPRIHFIHEPKRMDPGTCLNDLLRLAEGDHFSYIHTDNRLRPDYVRRFREALSAHPMALAYCEAYHIDEHGKVMRHSRRPSDYPLALLFSSDSLGVPFAATTALAREIGGFSSDDLADDVYFVVRADGLGPRIHIPEPLVDYRLHGGSRTEQWGEWKVRQAIYRSVLEAYRTRREDLPDPYAGCAARARTHVAAAAAVARPLASHLLGKVPASAPIWIDGVGMASAWLAWACAEEGRAPSGFIGKGFQTLLGLPVRAPEAGLPEGAVCLRPRRKGGVAGAVGPSPSLWLRRLLAGGPFSDHILKRLPHDLFAGLLVPQHAGTPQGTEVWVGAAGAQAAFLAFGAEALAGVRVAGWPGHPGGLAPAQGPSSPQPPEGAAVWSFPTAD